jgi:hypothetical protein
MPVVWWISIAAPALPRENGVPGDRPRGGDARDDLV